MSNLNEQQISNRLHKESFKDDFYKMGMTKNNSFSDYNKLQILKNKNPEEELSEWKTEDQAQVKKNTNTNHKNKLGFLPEMRHTRRSIEQLEKKVKIINEINQSTQLQRSDSKMDFKSYRYTFLKQFVNYTPKQRKSMNNVQLSKINMKLRFPSKYAKLQNLQIEQRSFYIQRSSYGLIPSIKKLVSPPAASRYLKKISQSESDLVYTPKQYKQNDLKWIEKDVEQEFLKKSIQERQKKVRLARIQKRLPTNFLNKFKKKSKSNQRQQQITRLNECLTLKRNQC